MEKNGYLVILYQVQLEIIFDEEGEKMQILLKNERRAEERIFFFTKFVKSFHC